MSIRSCWIILSFTIAIALSGLSALSKAKNMENDCLSCHEKVYKKVISNPYQHSPFKKRECGACHLEQWGIIKEKNAIKMEIAEPVVLDNLDYFTDHTVLLEGLTYEASYDINVVFKDLPGNKVSTSFKGVIPARLQDLKAYQRKPPAISKIRIGPITKAVFLQATITWDTNERSTSQVEYGLSDQYGRRTSKDIVLVTHHRVNLYELEEGKDYHFRVISQDMFGNEAVSEGCVFNTAKVSQVSDAEEKAGSSTASAELAVEKAEAYLRRKLEEKSDIILYLGTTRPANVTVEYVKVKDRCTGLNVGKGLAINACYRCHSLDALGLSHPVGVAAKPTTKIPDDLPTLEGGIITCVTCHNVHGGSMKSLARPKSTSCNTCHTE